jgi:hypothetical protein
MDCVGNSRKTSFNFPISITAAGFHVAGYVPFELAQLHVRHGGALYAPDLMAHHDPAKEIAERRRPGIVTAGLLAFVRNKVVPFDHGAELQAMERFGLDRGDGALGLTLPTRPALGKLPCCDLFEVGFDFEHYFLQIFSSIFAIRLKDRIIGATQLHHVSHVIPVKTGIQSFRHSLDSRLSPRLIRPLADPRE